MFSFNAGDGRCPTCGGSGFEHVEMQFLSDVYLRCPDCDGTPLPRRDPRREDRPPHAAATSCASSPSPTCSSSPSAEAVQLFRDDREVLRVLQPIVDVGLEYVKLGQPVPTLVGRRGAAPQARRLPRRGGAEPPAQPPGLARKGTLFMFDEPTTGLHFDDIAKLMRAFRKLLEAGHSLIVIEHNLDVIRAADWLIDLGPEGGEAGGEVVATARPRTCKRHAELAHRPRRCASTTARSASTAPRSRRARRCSTLLKPARRAPAPSTSRSASSTRASTT